MTMKKLLIALALAASANASAAESPFDGFVSVAVGGTDSDGSVNEMRNNYALGGSLAYTDKSGWGGQLDLDHFQHGWNNGVLSDARWESASTDVVGHLSYRNAHWLLGGFYANRRYTMEGNYSDTQRFVGLEGKLFLTDMTLYGQLGRNKWVESQDKGPFAYIQLDYYLNDNFRLSAGIGQMRSKYAANSADYKQTNIDLGAEYRLANSPFSGFASLGHVHETDGNWKVDSTTALFGIKYNFGQASLRKRDREGATLAPPPRVFQLMGDS